MAAATAVALAPAKREFHPVDLQQLNADKALIERTNQYIEANSQAVRSDFAAARKHFERKREQGVTGTVRYELVVTRPLPVARMNNKSSLVDHFESAGCERHLMMRNLYRSLCPAGITVETKKGSSMTLANCGDHAADTFTPVIAFVTYIPPALSK